MREKEFDELLKRYSEGRATKQEIERMNIFFDRLSANQPANEEILVGASVKTEIHNEIKSKIAKETKGITARPKVIRWLPNFLKVAAAIFIVAAGVTFYQFQYMEDGEVAVEYKVKSTDKGQKLTITLSDGSIVKLNAGTTLKYPAVFGNERREIELRGEAYFEVAEDENKPFIVSTGEITTTVLGTSFNIKAYPSSERMNISLIEGRVRIDKYEDETRSQMPDETYLTPGENIIYNKASFELKKGRFDVKKAISWKDNIIYFEKTPFIDAIHTLELWYGVEFTILNLKNDKMMVNGEFKNQSLDNVLQSMSYSKFTYQIKNDKVVINFN